MNATDMARRAALVADALDDVGVEPVSLYANDRGQVDVLVAPADYAAAVERLGLAAVEHLEQVACGRWADVPVWCQAYERAQVPA